MADEYFYAATLATKNASVTWDPTVKDDYPCNFKLLVRQFLLGHEAKAGEYNVIQVETMSQRDSVKIPIAVLCAGETRSISSDLEFPDAPVTFTLIEGSGPVYIHGQHLPGTLLEEIEEYGDEMEEDLGEEEEAEDDEDDDEVPKKKAKIQNNSGAKPTVAVKPSVVNANNKNNIPKKK